MQVTNLHIHTLNPSFYTQTLIRDALYFRKLHWILRIAAKRGNRASGPPYVIRLLATVMCVHQTTKKHITNTATIYDVHRGFVSLYICIATCAELWRPLCVQFSSCLHKEERIQVEGDSSANRRFACGELILKPKHDTSYVYVMCCLFLLRLGVVMILFSVIMTIKCFGT